LADVCLVPLKNIDGFESFIPSKMFEIMASGRPIIGSVRGEAADILTRSGGAIVIAPEDPQKLRSALLELATNSSRREELAANGKAFVAEFYNRETLAKEYLALLDGIA
jgi:glycosyltransferase involved in cell wall biosynthesis